VDSLPEYSKHTEPGRSLDHSTFGHTVVVTTDLRRIRIKIIFLLDINFPCRISTVKWNQIITFIGVLSYRNAQWCPR
jgi:hypothetical protein